MHTEERLKFYVLIRDRDLAWNVKLWDEWAATVVVLVIELGLLFQPEHFHSIHLNNPNTTSSFVEFPSG